MAQQSSRKPDSVVQVSVVLDSGIFLTDAASGHEDYSEVGYFLPRIVVYGDWQELKSINLDATQSKDRTISVRHLNPGKEEIVGGVDYSADFLTSLLRRKDLYDNDRPEIIPSRFDWILRFESGHFRASSVKERVFKLCDGYTNQANGQRKYLGPIAHDVVVHYDLGANESLDLSNDGGPLWSTADHPDVERRFDIEIVAPHRTAENYFRDALNHNGRDYWIPNQGDPDPMGRP